MSASAQPTSRKRNYLSVSIKNSIISTSFIPELYKYIESSTSVKICDIFMPNSNRIGCLSVKAKKIADKLMSIITCRSILRHGRHPSAKVTQINHNHFKIILSNLNNIITERQFIEWIMWSKKSLPISLQSCILFDIQLQEAETELPDNNDISDSKSDENTVKETECIITFDEIDEAIMVRDILNNKEFKGYPLYFIHWYPPRKPGYRYRDISNKESRNNSDKNDEYKGISTLNPSNSYSKSQLVLGPLWMRDPSVPKPPT